MLALSLIRAVQKDSYSNRVEDRRLGYWVEPELVKFLSSSNDSELRSHHFPKAGQGGLNKDTTMATRSYRTPKYFLKSFDELGTYA